MVDIKSLVPEVYRESRDFKVFLRLIDYIINPIKYDIDNWLDLYDPMACPVSFLPLLADLLGYTYNNSISAKENRIIMSKFVEMVKNKGSEIGIRLAAALSLNAQLASDPNSKEYQQAVDQMQYLEVYFDKENAEIVIYYPNSLKKIRDLLYYVRPVGTTVRFVATMFTNPANDVGITARVDYTKLHYDNKDQDINKSEVGLTQISDYIKESAVNTNE